MTVALTPGQEIVAFGQHLTVGARPPELSLAGPARLVQVGNTALDVQRLRVVGPLRPQLTLGPVQRNAAAADIFDPQAGPRARAEAAAAVRDGYLTWYLLGGLGLIAFTLAAAAGRDRAAHAGGAAPAEPICRRGTGRCRRSGPTARGRPAG